MADTTSEDFLYSSPVEYPAYGEPAVAEGAPRRRIPPMVMTGAWLAVGLVVGVLAMTVLHSSRGTNATGAPAGLAGNAQQGPLAGGPPGFAGPGGLDGEQHVVGTLTAVGASTITVHSMSGTTTYRIDATTQLVKDGQQVSSLAVMHVGDSVVVHIYPANGSTYVERVIATTSTTTTTT